MTIKSTSIEGVMIIQPTVFQDNRGYFMETFKSVELTKHLGYEVYFCQDNESSSTYGVLRGLHYQHPEFAQAKLVRVIRGLVLDVAVDMRKKSPSFGKHIAVELSEDNKKQLFIPRGFAHGFLTLSKNCIFSYKVDNPYNKKYDRGIIYNDPTLNIDWKLNTDNFKLSEKDSHLPKLCDITASDLF